MIFLTALGLTGCNGTGVTATQTPEATATPLPPTPTPIPAAMRVNGEIVLQMLYDGWLASYQIAYPESTEEDAQQAVLDELTEQMPLAQGAAENGYTVSEGELDARIQQSAESAGGEDKLAAWREANGFDEEQFREAMRLSMAAARQRDLIAEGVPQEAEQVKARQLLVLDEETANLYMGQLQAGAEFATLAALVDPTLSGDLNWFPRGYLTQPAVEEAAFALEPGQISGIVQSDIGYHIIEVLDKGVRPLTPEARLMLQHQAVADWLEERREQSEVEILLP